MSRTDRKQFIKYNRVVENVESVMATNNMNIVLYKTVPMTSWDEKMAPVGTHWTIVGIEENGEYYIDVYESDSNSNLISVSNTDEYEAYVSTQGKLDKLNASNIERIVDVYVKLVTTTSIFPQMSEYKRNVNK